MADLLVHRGPDDGSAVGIGSAALGHRRLSIIDVAGGHQPIANEDGRYHVVFNGEIYNYRTLMADLQSRGHKFSTRSDTEVIVHLYEEKGADCLADLNGMFAFAIWDNRDRTLFLASDRTGKKPLYYAQTADSIVFASEMKSLLIEPAIARSLNPRALSGFLTYQYVPAPQTIFDGIAKLEPAQWVRFAHGPGDGNSGEPFREQRRTYWSLNYEPKLQISEEAAREAVIEKLDEAVADRLESEVPLGILLSGGVDSSAIVAMARRHIAGPMSTFSIGFREQTHNELPHARKVAERYETDHEEFIVEPNAIDVLPQIVWHADEPFGDSSALPTFYLAQMTRRHVTVALGGDGGDESFAGYERYRGLPLVRRFSNVPRVIRAAAMPALDLASRLAPGSAFFDKAVLLNEISLMDADREYIAYLTIFHRRMKERLLAPEFAGRPADSDDALQWTLDKLAASDARESVDRKMATDIATYLPGALLVKADRMTMAASLEVRSPFLDHRLMEFAAGLPPDIKYPGGELKGLLKRALEPHLPHEIMYRPKQGFGVPLNDWFRGELKGLLYESLLGSRARARGIFNMKYVERLLAEHTSGRYHHAHRLWLLLVFEIWAQTFLDPASAPTGPIGALGN